VRAIVSGYYGFGNAGDEAVLAGIIAGMRQAAGAVEFTVLSGNPHITAHNHGVRSIGRFEWRALRQELAAADLFISGGGNLLQDVTSARSCLYYLAVMGRALQAGVPVMVLGQGIGPLRRRWLRALVRRRLNQVRGIAVRDSESARELARLGVTTTVRIAADLSLAMTLPDAQQVAQAYADLGVREGDPVLALVPRTWRIRGLGGEFLPRLASAIKQATARLRPAPRVVCFPMQRPHDEEACTALACAAGGVVAPRELPAPLLAGMIGSARTVVAMRLHGLIFAAMGGAAPVAVSYDPKVQAFMDDIGVGTAATTADLDACSAKRLLLCCDAFVRRSGTPSPAKAEPRDAGSRSREGRLVSAIAGAWDADAEARAALRRTMEQRREVVRDVFAWAASVARRD
jgi:polysaccharide pyruvyl transferase CsaB